MAIGIDLGAQGATVVFDDGASVIVPTDLGRRVVSDLIVRAGDPVPLVFRGADGGIVRRLAHDLYAEEIAHAMAEAGAAPRPTGGRGVAVALPSWWTARATAMTRDAIQALAGRKITTISDAEAAIRGYQARGGSVDDVTAVLDLGAQTSSAAVLAGCRSGRPQLVGQAGVQSSAAGDELDALILHHLLRSMKDQGLTVDRHDPVAIAAARDFVAQCRDARESLSVRSAVTLETDLAGGEARMRLVRSEFEEIARPWARDVVSMLRTTIESSGREVRSVLMVGGLARTPAVAQVISAELELALVADDDPALTVALGAMLAAGHADHRAAPSRGDRWRAGSTRGAVPVAAVPPVEALVPEIASAVEVPETEAPAEVVADTVPPEDAVPEALPVAPEPEPEPVDLDDVVAVPTSPERAPDALPTASYFSVPVPLAFAEAEPEPVAVEEPPVPDAEPVPDPEPEPVAEAEPVVLAEPTLPPVAPPPPAAPVLVEALPVAPPPEPEPVVEPAALIVPAPPLPAPPPAAAISADVPPPPVPSIGVLPEPQPEPEPPVEEVSHATSPLLAAAESLPFVEPEPEPWAPRARSGAELDASSGAESLEDGFGPSTVWGSWVPEEPATTNGVHPVEDVVDEPVVEEPPPPPFPHLAADPTPPPPVAAAPPAWPLVPTLSADVVPDEAPSLAADATAVEETTDHRAHVDHRGLRGRRARRAAERAAAHTPEIEVTLEDAEFQVAGPVELEPEAEAVPDVVADAAEVVDEVDASIAPPPAPRRRRGLRRGHDNPPPPAPVLDEPEASWTHELGRHEFVEAVEEPADETPTVDEHDDTPAPPPAPEAPTAVDEPPAPAGPIGHDPTIPEPAATWPPPRTWTHTPAPTPVPPPLDWLGSAPPGAPRQPRARRRGRRVDESAWAPPVAPPVPDETTGSTPDQPTIGEQQQSAPLWRSGARAEDLDADPAGDLTIITTEAVGADDAPTDPGDDRPDEGGRRGRRRLTVLILVGILGAGGAQLAWADRSGGDQEAPGGERLPVTRSTDVEPTSGPAPSTDAPTQEPPTADPTDPADPQPRATRAPRSSSPSPSSPATTVPPSPVTPTSPPTTQPTSEPTTTPTTEPTTEPEPTTTPDPEPSESVAVPDPGASD